MDDLISRKEAIQGVREYFSLGDCYCDELSIVGMLNKLPSAESEIIRCKDCIHWKHSKIKLNYCEVWNWQNTGDDFCSFAERKEDD